MNEPAPVTSIDLAVLRRRVTMLEQLVVRLGCGFSSLIIAISLFLPLWTLDSETEQTFTFIAIPFEALSAEESDGEAVFIAVLIGIALIAIIATIVALLSLCAEGARASGLHLAAISLGTLAVLGVWILTGMMNSRVDEKILGIALLPLTVGAALAIVAYQISVTLHGRKPPSKRA